MYSLRSSMPSHWHSPKARLSSPPVTQYLGSIHSCSIPAFPPCHWVLRFRPRVWHLLLPSTLSFASRFRPLVCHPLIRNSVPSPRITSHWPFLSRYSPYTCLLLATLLTHSTRSASHWPFLPRYSSYSGPYVHGRSGSTLKNSWGRCRWYPLVSPDLMYSRAAMATEFYSQRQLLSLPLSAGYLSLPHSAS